MKPDIIVDTPAWRWKKIAPSFHRIVILKAYRESISSKTIKDLSILESTPRLDNNKDEAFYFKMIPGDQFNSVGKVALANGGSKGIAKYIVIDLAQAGADTA